MNQENEHRTDVRRRGFLKTAALFETFLNEGGVQFQVNHVSRETLLQAEKTPENYGSLRVRVSGFST